ncbi:MAG: phage terminase small subunit P27 family [Gammaproteobacteria bacterium]|nr:phage terminase small subunit P27 family [Gammaproteobacteria bacterium]
MGQGRKPLPANVHLLRGNPSKKPAAALAGGLHPDVEIPPCPEELLSEDAKQEWARVTAELVKLKVIAQVDMAAVSVYCQAWGDWSSAQRKLRALGEAGYVDTTPSGYKQQSVWLQIANRAADTMKTYGALFGMNPSARSSVQPSQGNSEQLGLFGDDDQRQDGPAKYF